ncbi:MAG: HAMP domain-containing sensor histidine kinase [Prolixibacteraceae bacterium]
MSETLEETLKKPVLLERKINGLDSSRQIISSITHELRSPLAIISSNIQLLKQFNYDLDNKVVNETFHLCEEAVKSIKRFAEDISFIHGSNKGELKPESKKIEPDKFFDELIGKLPESDYSRKRVKYEKNIKAKTFYTDPRFLLKILENLLNNALKFSSEDVFLKVVCTKEELNIQLKDQGIGMLDEEIDYLFEPFSRGSNVKMISGSGLGLAIVKRSLDLLNGNMEVVSSVNHGTTFNIKILSNGSQKNIDN